MWLRKGREGPRARRSCVHSGRDAAADVARVRLYAVRAATPEGVHVEVHKPGRDDQARSVDGLGGIAVYGGLNSGHEPVLQRNVSDRVQALGRVDDGPSLDKQVVQGFFSPVDLARLVLQGWRTEYILFEQEVGEEVIDGHV